MLKKYWIFLLIPLQIVLLLCAPRFGWRMTHPSAVRLPYVSTNREGGTVRDTYASDGMTIDIAYAHRFSRAFTVSIDGGAVISMRVELDGSQQGDAVNAPTFTGSGIVWQDSSGLVYRIYLLAAALTAACLWLWLRARKRAAGRSALPYRVMAGAALCASLLVSLRVVL